MPAPPLSGRSALPLRQESLNEIAAFWPGRERYARTIHEALPSVGRVETEGHPYLSWVGTGFLVSRRRFLTVRSVASAFCDCLGDTSLRLKPGLRAFLASPKELGAVVSFRLSVTSVRFVHPYFDVALCDLAPGDVRLAAEAREPGLTLASDSNAYRKKRKVASLGFAAQDPRVPAETVKQSYGVLAEELYLQPGELLGLTTVQGIPALAHDCCALPGSGGAPLLDLESGDVLGIHYAGKSLRENFAVPSAQLALDRHVRSHGVIFSDDPPWMREWALSDAVGRQAEAESPPPPQTTEPPEVDTEVCHFSQANLYRLRDFLVEARFAQEDRQYILFVSMNPRYVSMLPTEGAPGARLLNVLNTLNHTPLLTNGELPFRTLLVNAVENSKPLPVAAKLQKFLDQLPVA